MSTPAVRTDSTPRLRLRQGFGGKGMRYNTNHLGVNQSYTKFCFLVPHRDDEATRGRLRHAGGLVARGFFNDFDAEGAREPLGLETIQFLVAERPHSSEEPFARAPYAVQVSAKYRPRLDEVEQELRRRVEGAAEVHALEGAIQAPRYTSAELYAFAYKRAASRSPGRVARNAILIPIKKTRDWWEKPPLDRHSFFYPHEDLVTRTPVKGHALAAEAGIATIYRRLYHNPDGYERDGEYDFLTYFECGDEHLALFDQVCRALRDERQNPEWRYVLEGPEWRGRRVLRW